MIFLLQEEEGKSDVVLQVPRQYEGIGSEGMAAWGTRM